jgi:hypothetical protein
MTETDRRSRVHKFLQQQLNAVDTDQANQPSDAIENNSDSEDDGDTALHEEAASVSSLDDIESFILSSKASMVCLSLLELL